MLLLELFVGAELFVTLAQKGAMMAVAQWQVVDDMCIHLDTKQRDWQTDGQKCDINIMLIAEHAGGWFCTFISIHSRKMLF